MKVNGVKILFCFRILLWVIALAATIYWIRFSFQIYEMGIYDPHEYATMFRPVFSRCLLITVVSIGISFLLRAVSDRLKNRGQE